jgi:hypothetical protein
MAVIVVLAFLAIIFLYIAANARTLSHLEKDVRLLEMRQTRRLAIANKTNSLAVTVFEIPDKNALGLSLDSDRSR